MPGLSLIVPCLNEAASLPALVERARAALRDPGLGAAGARELVLIDDGSTDDTWPWIERQRRAFPELRAVRHAQTRGIPAAWRSGLAEARGESICVIDADLQYEPEEVPRLWAARAETSADIVQGVRSERERRRDLRFVLSRGLSGLLNVSFGMSSRDNKSGFFLCRRQVFADLLDYRGAYRHWQCFVMVAAHSRGYRIHQVDTPFHPRRAGRSAFGTLALGPALGVAADLLTALREYRPVRR